MLPNFAYVRPESVEQAVEQLSSPTDRVFAGGSDLIGLPSRRMSSKPKRW